MMYLLFLHRFYIKTSTSCGIYFLKDSCGDRYLFPVFESNCGSKQHHIRGEIFWREQRLVLHQIIHFGLLCMLLNCLALKIAYHGPNT